MSSITYIRRENWDVWTLGGVGFQRHREHAIRAKADWPFLLCAVPPITRAVYEQFCDTRPLTGISGVRDGAPFHATRADLLKLWLADRRNAAS